MDDLKDLLYIKNLIIYMDCKIRSIETLDNEEYLKILKFIEDKYPMFKKDRLNSIRDAIDILNYFIAVYLVDEVEE